MLHILVILVASLFTVSAIPLKEWINATANHYGGPQDMARVDPFNPRILLGGCNYGDLNPTVYPFYNVASFHPESSITAGLDQFGCGTCFEIRCNDTPERCLNDTTYQSARNTPLVVVSSGTCGIGCGDRQASLHVYAFDKLAPIRLGNVAIQLRQVPCEPLGNLIVLVRNYRVTKEGYMKLVVRNIPLSGTLSSVRLRASAGGGGDWVIFNNIFGAAWEASHLPEPPFDIHLVESSGSEIILRNVITEPGFTGEIDTGKQFPGFFAFPLSAREISVDAEMSLSSPSLDVTDDTSSPVLSHPKRPEVDLSDLDPAVVVIDDDEFN